MKTFSSSRRTAMRWLVAGASLAPFATRAATELKGNSVYQLRPALTDQNGQPFAIASLRGHTVLASMFYSSCDMVCPMIFETILQTVQAVPSPERDTLKVLMVSFDPARDSVAVLRETARAHGCDARWTVARGEEADVRKLAAVLGVQYRRLSNGDFNHSSGIELLDADGRLAARTSTLGSVDPAFVKSLRQSLKTDA